jgi:hypothetical protein
MSRLFSSDKMYQGQQKFVDLAHPDLQANQKSLTPGIIGGQC